MLTLEREYEIISVPYSEQLKMWVAVKLSDID